MRSRPVAALSAVALVAISSAFAIHPATAEDLPTTPLPLCTSGGPPCVVKITEDGIDRTADPDFYWYAHRFKLEGARYFAFGVNHSSNPGGALDPTKQWEVVLNTGNVFPYETFARGQGVTVARGGNSTDGYRVGFKMFPTNMSYGACNSSGVCGSSAGNTENPGVLNGQVDNAGYADDPDYRESLRGFDFATNADWSSSPPMLNFDTRAIIIDVGNSHFHKDGTTLFIGHAEFKLPFNMLRHLYLVDDPASLTPGAFQVGTGTGPSPTVNVTVHDRSVGVDIYDITFSKRRLRIIGNTRPGRPRDLVAKRRSPTTGFLDWRSARSRGSKVRGYRVTCQRVGHKLTKDVTRTQASFGSLTPGRAYDCVVRAKSRAGLGRRATVRLRRG